MLSERQENRVVIHSQLTAVSSRPVAPGTTHSFTCLDRAMGMHSVHVIFYYPERLFGYFDLDWFRVSLSEVLSLYPPVTGRIVRKEDGGDLEVKCCDAGVRVVKATVGITLEEWMASADGSDERLLTAWDDMRHDPSSWSPYRIQINEFEGGGVAIGVSCLHMQADLTCATLLIKSWADTHRREPIEHQPSFQESPFARGGGPHVHSTNTKMSHAYFETKSTAALKIPTKMGTTTFKFSEATIKQCLLDIGNATPFDFLAALFWARIARLKPTDSEAKHSLSICLDLRKKLQLPYGYYGNTSHFSLLSVPDVEEMFIQGSDNELGYLASTVHRHVSSQGEDEFWSAVEWFETRNGKGDDNKFGAPFRMYGPELTCVSMEHMVDLNNEKEPLMYAAVFDNEKRPVHVSYHVGNVEGEGLIMVTPSPDGVLGRTVAVTLPEEELDQLCRDEAIVRLNPSIILGGSRRRT